MFKKIFFSVRFNQWKVLKYSSS